MRPELKIKMLADLDRVLALHANTRKLSPHTTEAIHDISKVISSALSVIERITGDNSPYTRQAREFSRFHNHMGSAFADKVQALHATMGVINSLREDIASDAIENIEELIHGELFGDFLEMASHLLDEGLLRMDRCNPKRQSR